MGHRESHVSTIGVLKSVLVVRCFHLFSVFVYVCIEELVFVYLKLSFSFSFLLFPLPVFFLSIVFLLFYLLVCPPLSSHSPLFPSFHSTKNSPFLFCIHFLLLHLVDGEGLSLRDDTAKSWPHCLHSFGLGISRCP